jgi:hypothetical protein
MSAASLLSPLQVGRICPCGWLVSLISVAQEMAAHHLFDMFPEWHKLS